MPAEVHRPGWTAVTEAAQVFECPSLLLCSPLLEVRDCDPHYLRVCGCCLGLDLALDAVLRSSVYHSHYL